MRLLNIHFGVIIYLFFCPNIYSSIDHELGDINHEKTKYFQEENDLLSSSSKWQKIYQIN